MPPIKEVVRNCFTQQTKDSFALESWHNYNLVIFSRSTKLFQQGSSSAFQFTFALTRGGVPSGLEEKTANEPSVHQLFLLTYLVS